MEIGVFGFGAPLGVLASVGLRPVDVTLRRAEGGTAADPYIEPFMDPFAASVLRGMAAGRFDDYGAILFLRESPGAMVACQYAFELRRRGVMPGQAPVPIMLNILPADHDAAQAFNKAELDRVVRELGALGWTPEAGTEGPGPAFADLIAAQSEGRITGAGGFAARAALAEGRSLPTIGRGRAEGERLALFGGPMGNAVLHAALDDIGVLALDQQALDQVYAAGGAGVDGALRAQAANPFAARQPEPRFVPGLEAALAEHRIDRVFWQVDPHDDLWGWLMPDVRDLCARLGVGFTDLGFLPRWPAPGDIVIGEHA